MSDDADGTNAMSGPGRANVLVEPHGDSDAPLHLLCRVRSALVAIPLGDVSETMRPLPVEPTAGAPDFVAGVSLVRGVVTPVVDLGHVLGGASRDFPARWVTLRVGDRRVALAVDQVVDVRAVPAALLDNAPPLTARADSHAIAALGALDAHLLIVIRGARIVPESAWSAFDARSAGK